MAIQKKHGKGRLDKWYRLAKEKGYRARAAFKLIQLNKKYGFLEKSKVLIDLCAAPGSWCQVAVEAMPVNSLIVGVDLAPIKPIPKVITFQSDITTEQCRATLRQHLKTWKADTVLHDGAPNVGTAWNQDSFNQAELALQAMRLATDFLIEGGTFVTKVFRSKDYNSLLWVFNQLFAKVEATKPPSSRNVSAEIFVVCRGFKAPKRIDPRFLDPRTVFEELANPTVNHEAKVFKPELKKRKREGYEEGQLLLFKKTPVTDFIHTEDPITILGEYNQLTFDTATPLAPAKEAQKSTGPDLAMTAIAKLEETTPEIQTLCRDLKVLGRRDFKQLLKWRLRVRELFGLAPPAKKTNAKDQTGDGKSAEEGATTGESEEVAAVESMDEELRLQKELEDLKSREDAKRKRERRKDNEKKQKDIVRMQLQMTTPTDIGLEEGAREGVFSLKTANRPEALKKIVRGNMVVVPEEDNDARPDFYNALPIRSADSDDDEGDDEASRLEAQLDTMYSTYQERLADADAKYRAKKARKERSGGFGEEDDEFEGFSGDEAAKNQDDDDDSSDLEEEDNSGDDDEGDTTKKSLIRELDGPETVEGSDLSKRARSFFNQGIFEDLDGLLDDGEEEEESRMTETVVQEKSAKKDGKTKKKESKKETTQKSDAKKSSVPLSAKDQEKQDEDDADEYSSDEDVAARGTDVDGDDGSAWEKEQRRPDGRPNIDIITAEAMTLAHQLATGEKTKTRVVDDGFNRYSFRDRDGLPEWFLDDEGQHSKPQKPITKAAADAIKEKLRALNARPIKKVREAKARKKFKAAQRLEKLRKKTDLLASDEGMTESEKASTISKMMAKAAKKKPHMPIKVVVAKGVNRGVKGRPKGVKKGRYKMIDPRMKKEMRAAKRIAKK